MPECRAQTPIGLPAPADSVPSPPVYAAAGVAIVVAFYVGVLGWMLRESDRGRTIRFVVVGGRLLWVADGLPIAQQPQLLREAADIRSHLPKVLSELYPP